MPVLSYLKLAIRDEARKDFEQDLDELLGLAPQQPGFRWVEVYQLRGDPSTYLILSEWETLEDLKAWEHSPRHEEAMTENEPRFRTPETHRRYAPYTPPPPTT